MRHFDEDLSLLQHIRDTLQQNNVHVAQKWFTAAHSRKQRHSLPESQLDWHEIVRSNIDAVIDSDALIIEGSRYN
jgi:hypothetical protein